MAQDFMETFGYGLDDKDITAADADGVALAAIQGLNCKLEQKQAEIDRLNQMLQQNQHKIEQQNALLLSYDKLFKSFEQRLLELERIDG